MDKGKEECLSPTRGKSAVKYYLTFECCTCKGPYVLLYLQILCNTDPSRVRLQTSWILHNVLIVVHDSISVYQLTLNDYDAMTTVHLYSEKQMPSDVPLQVS